MSKIKQHVINELGEEAYDTIEDLGKGGEDERVFRKVQNVDRGASKTTK